MRTPVEGLAKVINLGQFEQGAASEASLLGAVAAVKPDIPAAATYELARGLEEGVVQAAAAYKTQPGRW